MNNLEQGYNAARYDITNRGEAFAQDMYIAMIVGGKRDAFSTGYKMGLDA